jgi:hypothetical protein
MKEASGELNSGVIAVIAVAALAAFFFVVLWPMIRTNYNTSSKCSSAVCGFNCSDVKQSPSGGRIVCCYHKGKSDETTLTCPYKG